MSLYQSELITKEKRDKVINLELHFQGIPGESKLYLNRKKRSVLQKKAKIETTIQQKKNTFFCFTLPTFKTIDREKKFMKCFKETFFILACVDKMIII